jgi:2-amino-4-hydroxy-6-hydroxymethyldihydropteridine diphosphokinase
VSDRRYQALVSLGSNVDPGRWVPHALEALAARFGSLAASRLYDSLPVGTAPGTPPFVNAACRFRTDLPPRALRAVLRHLEALAGRRRGPDRFAPRTLDLDLLHEEPAGRDRHVPPPDLLREAHVLVPSAEVWPDLVLAGETRDLATLRDARFGRAAPGLSVRAPSPIR